VRRRPSVSYSGKKYLNLFVTELCSTYITYADLKILSQLLVYRLGLSNGQAIDLMEKNEDSFDLTEKEDTDLEIDGLRDEGHPQKLMFWFYRRPTKLCR